MSKKPAPPAGPGGTLGDWLRREGVTVGTPPPVAPSTPAAEPLDLGGAQKVVVRRERKGRGGKTATLIEGIKLPPSGLERIAREVRRALGCGASVDGPTIVVQGDMAARLEPWLLARGAKKVVVGS